MNVPPAEITTNIDNIKKTPLKLRFSFWYRISEEQSQQTVIDKKAYENQVKKIADFETIEDFWAIFQHLRKPDSCNPGIEFHLFKAGIKPMWEDEQNKNGGQVSIKLAKYYTTIIWEEMIFAFIGNVLPEIINGIIVSIRPKFNILHIWFNNYNQENNKIIEDTIRDLLQIPPEVKLEFKKFN